MHSVVSGLWRKKRNNPYAHFINYKFVKKA